MDNLTISDFERLMHVQQGPCVSLYLPTTRVSNKEKRQDSIRLRNLLREAEERLVQGGTNARDAQKLLMPAQSLVDDNAFWEHQSDGLAVLLWPNGSEVFRLPCEFKELVVVAPRLHLKPVLQVLDRSGSFYVLALSQKHLRLYSLSRHTIERCSLGGVPDNMDEALQLDESGDRRQFRADTGAGAAQRPGSFHGQGVGTDSIEHKKDILRYFQMVDTALVNGPLKARTAPLILAGPEFLIPMYREANSYKNMYPAGLAIHADGLSDRDLREKALELLKPYLEEKKRKAVEMFHQLRGTPKASDSIEQIVSAAYGGRVQIIFTPVGVQRWGAFDSSTLSARIHDGKEPFDYDLLDFAAVQTALHDGTVYAVKPEEMPDHTSLAAVFRY